jgi:hypothetical protein
MLMVAAHEGASCSCPAKAPDVCEKELQASCKGLAVGKYCGMKHRSLRGRLCKTATPVRTGLVRALIFCY